MGKRVMVMEVTGKRRTGIPKRRWLDNIKNDLSERELSGEEAQCSQRSYIDARMSRYARKVKCLISPTDWVPGYNKNIPEVYLCTRPPVQSPVNVASD